MSFLNNLFGFDPMAVISDSKVNSQEDWEATIRTKFEGETNMNDECQNWIAKFGLASKTSWIVRCTFPNMMRLVYRKKMFCQHNSDNKRKSNTSKESTKRDANCKANINFVVKRITRDTAKRDKYIKNGLNVIIKICFKHTHRVYVAQAYQLLRMHADTREQYFAYFADGKNSKVAHTFHELWLMNEAGERNVAAILSDFQINPKFRQVDIIYEKWKALQAASQDDSEAAQASPLETKLLSLAESGLELVAPGNGVVCLVTPLMRRAHGLEQAKEVCFIDSTHFPLRMPRPSKSKKKRRLAESSTDLSEANDSSASAPNGTNGTSVKRNAPVKKGIGGKTESTAVTLVYTATKFGPIPLACVLHSDLSQEDFSHAMAALKEAVGPTGFGGQGWPNVFMAADIPDTKTALVQAFPESLVQLSPARLCQAHWKWLWDIRHGVSREDVVHLMERFRDMVYAPSIQAAELRYNEMMEDPVTVQHNNLVRNMNAFWERNKEWCLCFQEQARGSTTNLFVEASIRAFKDIVVAQCRDFDVGALLDVIVHIVDVFYANRLIDLATDREERPPPIYYKFLHLARNTPLRRTSSCVFESDCTAIPGIKVLVYPDLALCECSRVGALCVHLTAAQSALAVPSAPPLSLDERRMCSVLALGFLQDPLLLKSEPGMEPELVLEEVVEATEFLAEQDFVLPAPGTSKRLPPLVPPDSASDHGDETPLEAGACSDADSDDSSLPDHEEACLRFSRETERILTMLRSNPDLTRQIWNASKRATAVMTQEQLAVFLKDIVGEASKEGGT